MLGEPVLDDELGRRGVFGGLRTALHQHHEALSVRGDIIGVQVEKLKKVSLEQDFGALRPRLPKTALSCSVLFANVTVTW